MSKLKSLDELTSNKTTTNEAVKIMNEYLESEEGQKVLEKYWIETYKNEYAEQVGIIIENENLIAEQEATLTKLRREVEVKNDQLARKKIAEAYLARNSLTPQKKQLKSLNETNELYIKHRMTDAEELAVKTYVKNPSNVEFIKKLMDKGSTFGEALVEANIGKYNLDLVLRGIDALKKGNSLTNMRNSHLY